LRICVVNSGSPQAIVRTLAMHEFCDVTCFIEVATPTRNHSLLRNRDIPVVYVPPAERGGLFSIVRELQHVDADAFVCHYASGSHVYACLLAEKKPLCLVAMGHDVLFKEGDMRLAWSEKLLVKAAVRRADMVAAKSLVVKTRAMSWRPRGTVEVNYWGVDRSLFIPGSMEAARARLGIQADRHILLSPRAFERRCNIRLIAEAFAELAKEDDHLDVLFIGMATDQEYVEEIREFIEKRGLNQRARFVMQVGVHDVISYYQAADVAVSIARSEGFPNTVLELMACKTPIVVGRIRQTEELLEHGRNAILVNLKLMDICDGIKWALNPANYLDLESILASGVQTIEKNADLVYNARNFVESIKRVSSRRSWMDKYFLFFLLILQYLTHRFDGRSVNRQ